MSYQLVKIKNLYKQFSKPLFEGLDLVLSRGDKIALVGENGCGKTTLIRILLGLETPDSGKIEVSCSIGYLPQEAESRTLSSGEKTRESLARAFADDPDLVILDEPTNHLDEDGVAWLKRLILRRKGAVLMISHDRKFLNATCNAFSELRGKKLSVYRGNYDEFLVLKEDAVARRGKAHEAQREEMETLRQKIKALSYSRKGPGKPKDKNIMAYDYRGHNFEGHVSRTLRSLKDRLQTLEENPLENPSPPSVKGIAFAKAVCSSPVAISLGSFALARNGRIVLTGPNGCGKTSFLKQLLKEGKAAPSAKIGYLDQEATGFPMESTPLEYFGISEKELRSELHKAKLRGGDLLHTPFGSLSAGERKRLALLHLMLQKPNVLILDEPTNHLDLETVEDLERALMEFEGAILAVSHDAMFIEKFSPPLTFKELLTYNLTP